MRRIPFVDLHAQYLSIKPKIDAAISDVIARCAFIRGPDVDAFEKNWAATVGLKHCISCANGTDALYIAMRSLGIRPGDEVITTAHSWIATTETITQAGGRVVFCDTDYDTFTIDPTQIESKITSATVGIIPVHLYGQPADMDAVMQIARKHNLWVIEDCAQAHLARFKDKLVGTFGDIATFSFYPGKNLGAYGDAGCIATNDDQLADWMTAFSRHGGKGTHIMEGINSRMDGLQGAILNVKLQYLADWTERRRHVAQEYQQRLGPISGIETPITAADRDHVYHLYVIRTDRRDELKKYLADAGIETVINYPRALPFYPAYSYLGARPADFPIAFANQSRILSLPIYPELDSEVISLISDHIERFCADGGQ